MKRIIATLAAALIGLSAFAQVGISVGGSFGFTFSSLSSRSPGGKSQKQASGVSFKLLPEIGYKIMDPLTVGATVGYLNGYAALGSFSLTDFKGLANIAIGTGSDLYLNKDTGNALHGLTFAPFARYTILHTKWVDLFVEGSMGYTLAIYRGMSVDTSSISLDGFLDDDEEGGGESGIKTTTATTKLNILELTGRPGIALNLGDRFKITAKLGALGIQHGWTKDEDGDVESVTRGGFDIDSNSLLLGVSVCF